MRVYGCLLDELQNTKFSYCHGVVVILAESPILTTDTLYLGQGERCKQRY